jgi:hypothetical protein
MKDDLHEAKGSYFESTVFEREEFIVTKLGNICVAPVPRGIVHCLFSAKLSPGTL